MTEFNEDYFATKPQAADTKDGANNDLDHSGVHQALSGFKSTGMIVSGSFRSVSLMDNRPTKGQKAVVLLLNIILPVVATVIGGLYMDECPVEPMIPIWCIVTGSVAVISSIIELLIVVRGEQYQKAPCIIHVFLPIWFIVGGVYTYRNFQPNYMAPVGGIIYPEIYEYCNFILYQFTFWYITAYFAVICFTIFCCCCCGCLAITGLFASIKLQLLKM